MLNFGIDDETISDDDFASERRDSTDMLLGSVEIFSGLGELSLPSQLVYTETGHSYCVRSCTSSFERGYNCANSNTWRASVRMGSY